MKLRGATNRGDLIFRWILIGSGVFVVGVLALMIYVMAGDSMSVFHHFGLRFLYGTHWQPVQSKLHKPEFSALPFIYGTLVSSLLALLIAVPLSLGTAIFLTEWAPLKVRGPVSFLVELLAAIPSVVYGLWAIFYLVPILRKTVMPFLVKTLGFLPFFKGPVVGFSMFSAGVILAIMILPFITAMSREVLRTVPNTQREAALALGATRWEAIWTAVLPFGRSGIVGAVILGWGRALGETMAVTMVIGNSHVIKLSLFQPGYTMASVIANEITEATYPLYTHSLITIGLLLFAVSFLVNGLARFLIARMTKFSGAGAN